MRRPGKAPWMGEVQALRANRGRKLDGLVAIVTVARATVAAVQFRRGYRLVGERVQLTRAQRTFDGDAPLRPGIDTSRDDQQPLPVLRAPILAIVRTPDGAGARRRGVPSRRAG
jgi:hypothetical protein